MKYWRPLKAVWLWFGLFLFCMLLCIAVAEIVFFYPQAQRYFDNSKSLTAQPLSTRSRGYLHRSLELASTLPFDYSYYAQIRQNLDIAYGVLNIELFIQQYPCTTLSLKKIDSLAQQLDSKTPPDIALFTHTLLPVLQCTDHIHTGQEHKRAALAIEMLEDLSLQRTLLFWGTLLMFTIAISSGVLHLKHSKIITHNRHETRKWVRHAMRDSLTGVLNRRAFDTDLAQYVKRYIHNGESFSLLMCDLDYFKQYNDTLGHVEGDKALKHIAKTLDQALRDNDKLYRYGGEEMAIILDNTNNFQARQIGLRILKLIREQQLPHPTSEFGSITTSIGCATFSEEVKSAEGLIKKADSHLYAAKQSGRNCLIDNDA